MRCALMTHARARDAGCEYHINRPLCILHGIALHGAAHATRVWLMMWLLAAGCCWLLARGCAPPITGNYLR